ncbi:hypothetical protein GOODEAATRI_027419 [Goodea atripinnis]|uniref:Uncharacterized protein n=1 Tax=Goodea atripinnis TaxID=208336 RepID=A0ABV0PS35_9TELE
MCTTSAQRHSSSDPSDSRPGPSSSPPSSHTRLKAQEHTLTAPMVEVMGPNGPNLVFRSCTSLSPTTPPQTLITYLNVSSPEVMLQVETGFSAKNTWITFTAKSTNMTECIACSSARPQLFTTPAPLLYNTDRPGFDCMLALHMTPSSQHCSTLSDLFTPANNHSFPPVFTPRAGNHTCLTRRN